MIKKCLERLYNGIIKENPTLVLMLGMCPTLAVTTSATNGAGMGLSTMVVLVMSNMLISMLRKIIPDKVRIPAFIVIVASFVTIVQLLIEAYLPELNESLGIYIPLIVVNCIILGRAESYASKNPVLPSIFDGIGMGLGFTVALTILGAIRELIGAGTVFNYALPFLKNYEPFAIFIMAPGAFFVLAVLTAIQNKLQLKSATNIDMPDDAPIACGGNCAACVGAVCIENRKILDGEKLAREAEKQAKLKAAQEAKLAAQGKMQENVANADTPQAENIKDNDKDSVRAEQTKSDKGGTEA